jgi:hypothetical protein
MGSDAPRHVDAGVARAFRPAAVEEREVHVRNNYQVWGGMRVQFRRSRAPNGRWHGPVIRKD